MPHGDEVVGVLGGGDVFGVQLKIIVHVLMDYREVIGSFTGIAIAPGLFAAYELGEATVERHEVDIETVKA